MGITAASEVQYQNAIRQLFPLGEYWNRQFSDPDSDVSLFIKAKTPELVRFRERMSALQVESIIETTDELIADWERVLLGAVSVNLDLEARRLLIKSKIDVRLNRTELQKVAAVFDMTIMGIEFPYKPGFFGFAKFALERAASFTAFSVLKIKVTREGIEADLWARVKTELDRHRFTQVRFGQNRLAYFPLPEVFENISFYKRFERVLLDEHITRTKPYREFEKAIGDKLLANHVPVFFYGGE